MLVPLDGQPSPQLRLHYPRYTEQPSPHPLSAGIGNIEAVLGTGVTLRAKADRPLRAAWIEFLPDNPQVILGAYLVPFGAAHPFDSAALTVGGQAVTALFPLHSTAIGRGSPLNSYRAFTATICCNLKTTPAWRAFAGSSCACATTPHLWCNSTGPRLPATSCMCCPTPNCHCTFSPKIPSSPCALSSCATAPSGPRNRAALSLYDHAARMRAAASRRGDRPQRAGGKRMETTADKSRIPPNAIAAHDSTSQRLLVARGRCRHLAGCGGRLRRCDV